MRRFKSDIPPNVVEQITREFRRDGLAIFDRLTVCILNGEVVGQRAYGEEGQLVTETPLRNGSKHGRAAFPSEGQFAPTRVSDGN